MTGPIEMAGSCVKAHDLVLPRARDVKIYMGKPLMALLRAMQAGGIMFGVPQAADVAYVIQPPEGQEDGMLVLAKDTCTVYVHTDRYEAIKRIVERAFGKPS